MRLRQYIWNLAKSVVIMALLLTWNLRHTAQGWQLPLGPFTIWVFVSWLAAYPWLRQWYANLYSKDDERMESYKNRALALHERDLAQHHTARKWTPSGLQANPWLYMSGNTQTTDDILNPLYVFCEHLWVTFILLLLGPILLAGHWAKRAWLRWRH
ncbi:hypothetical protein ACS4N0_02280 [Levilactobacillus zymae]|uniref:hypothetical protein n=1 Tax=Levilactobacillus zymae TaxID=267363 RepID=UPI003FCDC9C3